MTKQNTGSTGAIILTAKPSVRQRDIEVSIFPITNGEYVDCPGDRAVGIDTASDQEIAFIRNSIAVDCWESQGGVEREGVD